MRKRSKQQQQERWEPPKLGVVKINTDAAISTQMVRIGKGIIARNWTGKIMKARGIVEWKSGKAVEEEALAVRVALRMAKDARWTKIKSNQIANPWWTKSMQALFKTLVLQQSWRILRR